MGEVVYGYPLFQTGWIILFDSRQALPTGEGWRFKSAAVMIPSWTPTSNHRRGMSHFAAGPRLSWAAGSQPDPLAVL
jgi:hypothetical protein